MKLGVSVGYWGLGITAAQQLEIARTAEDLGYDSIWSAEAYGSDAASIDQISGGRMLLGLGTSGPQVSEGWHGVRFPKQVERTREYVAVVRMALAHKPVEFHGQTLELPLPDGPGKVLKLTIRPVQERIPIYLAVLGPKNVALAGEIADGWLPVYFSPEHVERLRLPLEEGAARAGRSLDGFRICPSVHVIIGDDIESARNAMRPVLALYIGGMGSREQNFYNRLVSGYGFEAAAREVQELYLSGQRAAAMEALPDELIDMVTIAGPKEHARERIRAYRDAGVETLIVSPMAPDAEERQNQLRLVAELAAS